MLDGPSLAAWDGATRLSSLRTVPAPMRLPPEPVHRIPTDPDEDAPGPGTALCLSGGGFRAMLFHAGALWRLADAGLLPGLAQVSSVSGGSLAAGMLAHRWRDLRFDAQGRPAPGAFETAVVAPLRALANQTLDIPDVVKGLVLPGSPADHLARSYRHLFGDATLQDLPDAPAFVLSATSVQSMAIWRFSKRAMADWRVGRILSPTVPLAVAVAASSAFPPFLSPLELDLDPASFEPGSGHDLQVEPYTRKAVLTDGGVYDNLGIETAWKKHGTILVSDAGGAPDPDPAPAKDWALHSYRAFNIIDNQVVDLRKRQVVGAYVDGTRRGAYWGIRSDIGHYGLKDPLPCPPERTYDLARIGTRLAHLDDATQQRLVNWGFAVCDAALRRHVDPELGRPDGFPYPVAGV